MLKKLITAVAMLAGIIFACVPSSHATLGQVMSTTTVPGATQIPFIFLARKGEGINYVATSTSPLNPGTTIQLEFSSNMSNWAIYVASACGPGGLGLGLNANTAPFNSDTYFRWNIISTNAAQVPLTLTIQDIDDNVSVIKNTKQLDLAYFNDDSLNIFGILKADRFQLQLSSGGSDLWISSGVQLLYGMPPTQDKVYPWSVTFASYSQLIDKTFTVLRSTGGIGQGGGITLSATPTISTTSARDGDIVLFTANTSSVTFQSEQTLAGTKLVLGAATRAVGSSDYLCLIFFRGYWRELFFSNNLGIEP